MFKKHVLPPRPDDIQDAKDMRAGDAEQLATLTAQRNYVLRLGDTVAAITEARKFDHFGDKLNDTFTRRKGIKHGV